MYDAIVAGLGGIGSAASYQFAGQGKRVLGLESLDSRACMYTNTPDLHFVISLHHDHPHVAIAAGFPGHGYKFASNPTIRSRG